MDIPDILRDSSIKRKACSGAALIRECPVKLESMVSYTELETLRLCS